MVVVMVIVAASLRFTNHDAVPYVRWQYCTTSQTLLAVQNILQNPNIFNTSHETLLFVPPGDQNVTIFVLHAGSSDLP